MELGEISRKIYKYLKEKTTNEANIQRRQQHGQEETEIRKGVGRKQKRETTPRRKWRGSYGVVWLHSKNEAGKGDHSC